MPLPPGKASRTADRSGNGRALHPAARPALRGLHGRGGDTWPPQPCPAIRRRPVTRLADSGGPQAPPSPSSRLFAVPVAAFRGPSCNAAARWRNAVSGTLHSTAPPRRHAASGRPPRARNSPAARGGLIRNGAFVAVSLALMGRSKGARETERRGTVRSEPCASPRRIRDQPGGELGESRRCRVASRRAPSLWKASRRVSRVDSGPSASSGVQDPGQSVRRGAANGREWHRRPASPARPATAPARNLSRPPALMTGRWASSPGPAMARQWPPTRLNPNSTRVACRSVSLAPVEMRAGARETGRRNSVRISRQVSGLSIGTTACLACAPRYRSGPVRF